MILKKAKIQVKKSVSSFKQGCIDNNFKNLGSDLSKYVATTVKNEWECLEKCSNTFGCKFWTLNEKNNCYLKDANALNNRTEFQGAFSGSPHCPGNSNKCVKQLA